MPGPVLAELRAPCRQLADERGELAVQRVASGFQPDDGGGGAAGQGPVDVVVAGAGVQEDEPGDVRSPFGVEVGCVQCPAQEVGRDEVLVRVVHEGRDREVVQDPLDRGAHRPLRLPGGRRRRHGGGAGQVEQVHAFGIIELERPCDPVEYALGGAADVAALQPRVVVHADPGQQRDLLATQARHPSFPAEIGQARLRRGDVRAAGDQELPYLVLRAHDSTVIPVGGCPGGPVGTPRAAADCRREREGAVATPGAWRCR